MAWTQKLPSGRYVGRYRVDGKVKSAGTFSTERQASTAAGEAESAARGYGELTWSEWWAIWEPAHLSDGRLTQTVEAYKRAERIHIRPRWGDVLITEITPEKMHLWARQLRRDLSVSHTKRIVNVMGIALGDARLAGRIGSNPALGLKVRGEDVDDSAPQFLSEEEAEAVRAGLMEPEDRAIFDFLIGTGLRVGEAAGLCWEDVDLDSGVIRVARSYSRHHHEYGPTKTRKVRRVPITDKLVMQLRLRRELMGVGEPLSTVTVNLVERPTTGPVFLSPRGWPLNALGFLRKLKVAGDSAGVENVTNHMLRHTYASWLVQRGVGLQQVQKLLGHTTIRTTEVYADLADTMHDDVRAALGR